MKRIEEIEEAITNLPPDEYRRLAHWFLCREQSLWDEQMNQDSASGKLDFLFLEAHNESNQGLVRDWPPTK